MRGVLSEEREVSGGRGPPAETSGREEGVPGRVVSEQGLCRRRSSFWETGFGRQRIRESPGRKLDFPREGQRARATVTIHSVFRVHGVPTVHPQTALDAGIFCIFQR